MKIVTTLLIVLTTCISAHTSPLPEYPFIFARGRAHTEIVPDLAEISLKVIVVNTDLQKATKDEHQQSSEILDILDKLEIERTDIIAYELEKNSIPLSNYTSAVIDDVLDTIKDPESRKYLLSVIKAGDLNLVNYRFERRFKIILRDLKKYDKIIDQVLLLKHVELYHTEFNHSDREKLEDELMAKACKDAKQDALNIAKGFGVELGNLKAVSKNGFQNIGGPFGLGDLDRSTAIYSTRWVNGKTHCSYLQQ
jgi:uncharacterized protein YggE